MARVIDPLGSDADSHALLAEWRANFGAPLGLYFRRRGASVLDSEDLTQEVFLRLVRRGDLRDVRAADQFIFRVAANVLTDWRRRGAARAEGLHDEFSDALKLADQGATQERVLIGKDRLKRLRAALAQLPERTQTVFSSHHFEGMTYSEIALRCGIAIRTIEDHMARANAALLRSIGEL